MRYAGAIVIGLAGIVLVLAGLTRLFPEDCAALSCSSEHAKGVALCVSGGVCLVLAVGAAAFVEMRRK
ncbi:MAG TPA: hypothetical protein VI318_01945 [Baekduia sp.]